MLLNLTNDLMDLAKLEKMKFELNNEFFNLSNTISNSFKALEYFSNCKNIKPRFQIDDKIKPYF